MCTFCLVLSNKKILLNLLHVSETEKGTRESNKEQRANSYLSNQETSTLHVVIGDCDVQSVELPMHQVIDVALVSLQNLLHRTEDGTAT